MEWIQVTKASKAALKDGDIAWCYSRDIKACRTMIWRGTWKVHGEEHFSLSGITKFILLPRK